MIQPQYFQQQYPQAPSAVSINIYEPKSYGSAPAATQAPYDYSNQLYGIPQASAWAPAPQGMTSPYQQYAIPQFAPQFMPAPQVMPQPVAQQPMPQSAIETAPAAATQETQPPMPQVVEGEQPPKVDTDMLIADLKSTNLDTQREAVTAIANFTQSTPDIGLQVATDPVKQALVDIINADTSALADTTPEQQAIIDKQAKGEALTPEEQAQLDQASPKVAADRNKIFAMFTLAMVQKLARDNMEQYSQFQTEQGQPAVQNLPLNGLMGYNELVNTIQNNPNAELKIAAIQALQYMAKPEEKAEVEQILQPALNDADPNVKQTAQDAIAKLTDTATPAQ